MFKTEQELNLVVAKDLHTNVELGKVYYFGDNPIVVTDLYVREAARRRGVGTFLLKYIQKNNKIILGTLTANVLAREFYKKVGFIEVGRMRLDPESLILERNP
jgi:ribosomal protein S18 acetylase RimI-like enzyme